MREKFYFGTRWDKGCWIRYSTTKWVETFTEIKINVYQKTSDGIFLQSIHAEPGRYWRSLRITYNRCINLGFARPANEEHGEIGMPLHYRWNCALARTATFSNKEPALCIKSFCDFPSAKPPGIWSSNVNRYRGKIGSWPFRNNHSGRSDGNVEKCHVEKGVVIC
jgi:hypothetical protein